MGTEVLRTEDWLRGRFPPETLASTPLRSRRNPNPNPSHTRFGRRKRSPVGFQEKENGRDRCPTMVVKMPTKDLVMERVTILKRGEKLNTPKTKDRGSGVVEAKNEVKIVDDEDSVLCSTDRWGPEPEMVPKQIRLADVNAIDGVYAGSAFFTSPPPSSVPLPAFFTKKGAFGKNDAATTNLRRLLRLDLP